MPQRRGALEKLVLHATSLRIPIVEVEGGSLTSLAGFDGHQGVALVVEPRRYASLEDILARALERGEPPFVLVLNSLEDPHNVGSLLRSAEAAGVHGVLFPTHRQAPLSPSAVKASAGAVEHLLLCPVDDLPGALSDLHVRGVRIAGADGEAPLTARQSDLRGPLAIVVGSEGQGLGSAVRRRADLFIRIPMRGAVGSLNAAVAGSILLFEAVAQREPARGSAPVTSPDATETVSTDAAAAEATPDASPSTGKSRATRKPKAATEAATATSKVQPKPKAAAKPKAAKAKPEPKVKAVAATKAEPKPKPEPTTTTASATTKAKATTKVSAAKVSAAKAPAATVTTSRSKPAPTKARASKPKPAAADDPPAAPTRAPARRRTARAAASSEAASTDAPDPTDDDLLPGGPTDPHA